MKSHKEIAIECGYLNGISIHSNTETIKTLFYKAMNEVAKQAFEAARDDIENNECNIRIDEPDTYFKLTYESFEDYLKEINDEGI